jgi:hypothetical protein
VATSSWSGSLNRNVPRMLVVLINLMALNLSDLIKEGGYQSKFLYKESISEIGEQHSKKLLNLLILRNLSNTPKGVKFSRRI